MDSKDAIQLNIGTLFHGLLFAYQKATKDILGSGSEVFVQPMIQILEGIYDEKGIQLFKDRNLEDAVASFSEMLEEGKIVKEVSFKKVGRARYLLKIDGCIWARHIHKELKPKDATCPIALIVMAIYSKYSHEKVEETESTYYEDGTETEIKSFNPASTWRTSVVEQTT
jgi:hypothetical protein